MDITEPSPANGAGKCSGQNAVTAKPSGLRERRFVREPATVETEQENEAPATNFDTTQSRANFALCKNGVCPIRGKDLIQDNSGVQRVQMVQGLPSNSWSKGAWSGLLRGRYKVP